MPSSRRSAISFARSPCSATTTRDLLTRAAEDCAGLLADDEGLETVLGIIGRALPERLRETAYVLACDVAAADLAADQEELRLLEMLRHHLDIDRLAAAAIERAARARPRHGLRRPAGGDPDRMTGAAAGVALVTGAGLSHRPRHRPRPGASGLRGPPCITIARPLPRAPWSTPYRPAAGAPRRSPRISRTIGLPRRWCRAAPRRWGR